METKEGKSKPKDQKTGGANEKSASKKNHKPQDAVERVHEVFTPKPPQHMDPSKDPGKSSDDTTSDKKSGNR